MPKNTDPSITVRVGPISETIRKAMSRRQYLSVNIIAGRVSKDIPPDAVQKHYVKYQNYFSSEFMAAANIVGNRLCSMAKSGTVVRRKGKDGKWEYALPPKPKKPSR